MRLDRANRQIQTFGDDGVRQTVSEQAQHLGLPSGDTVRRQFVRNLGADPPAAGHGPARVAEEPADAGALQLRARGLVDIECFAQPARPGGPGEYLRGQQVHERDVQRHAPDDRRDDRARA